jgi:hypothetical protein
LPAAAGLERACIDAAAVESSRELSLLFLQQLLQQLPLLISQSQQSQQQHEHAGGAIAHAITHVQQLSQTAVQLREQRQLVDSNNAATAAATTAAQLSPSVSIPAAVEAPPATAVDVSPVECDMSGQHTMQVALPEAVTAASKPTTAVADSMHYAPASEAFCTLPCPSLSAAAACEAATAAALLDAADLYLASLLSSRLGASQQQQQLGRLRAAMLRLAGLPPSHAARRRLATDLAWVQAWEGVWERQQQQQ